MNVLRDLNREDTELTKEELNEKKKVILALMSDPMYKPMRIRDIAVFLDVPKARREDLKLVLDELCAEGKIRVSQRGKYGKPEKQDVIGTFLANARGFGFVRTEETEQDIFIPREAAHGALDGDTVRVSVEPGQRFRSAEGVVLEILKHANERIVGYYRRVKNFGLVIPDNQKITEDVYIPPSKARGAVTGHKVVVRVTKFPSHRDEQPEGEVVEILGHVTDPGTDILSIVRAYDLPEAFPEDVLAEAERTADGVTEEELSGRRDLRDVLTVTIDGEDAKDLDDAVSIEALEDGWQLGVHIADVTAYVPEDSALDREAFRRSTSVYMADRVIPMLPRRLSNGICSLNEGEDRLALSCIMKISGNGVVTDHEICESVIRVDRRLSYPVVNQIITNGEPELTDRYLPLVPMLLEMKKAAEALRGKRGERGFIDFDFPETKVILDGEGTPVEVKAGERNAATRLIEDFMLAANETVAEEYSWRRVPFLYRVHDKPDPEKMRALSVFVANFGFTLKTRNGEVHPHEIRKLLSGIEGTDAESLVSRITLRSMKRAVYSTECTGHFGLAAQYYTHFTSPIRRYPDLQIHRIIKECLHGKLDAERAARLEKRLPDVAVQTSRLERRAEEAERESVKYKICEYMEKRIGEVYEGVISGVTRYGLYVELPNTIEGMIRIQELRDDYYEFIEDRWELYGEMTGKHYRLGERIWVKVDAADRLARTVDLVPARRPGHMTPLEDMD